MLSDDDKRLIVKEAANRLENPLRRRLLKNGLSFGALVMLTGCLLDDHQSVEDMLSRIDRMNDRFQAALFNPKDLAPEYSEDMITRPFPFNAYYSPSQIRPVPENYFLKLGGLVDGPKQITLAELYAMPQYSQTTRLVCVEGWSAIGKWNGVRLRDFLAQVGGDMTAKYVGFNCFDGYSTSIDMPTALHDQTFLTLEFDDQKLAPEYGAPLRLRMPTKLGFKNAKYIAEIYVTNTYPGGYWEDKGYNWFAGL